MCRLGSPEHATHISAALPPCWRRRPTGLDEDELQQVIGELEQRGRALFVRWSRDIRENDEVGSHDDGGWPAGNVYCSLIEIAARVAGNRLV